MLIVYWCSCIIYPSNRYTDRVVKKTALTLPVLCQHQRSWLCHRSIDQVLEMEPRQLGCGGRHQLKLRQCDQCKRVPEMRFTSYCSDPFPHCSPCLFFQRSQNASTLAPLTEEFPASHFHTGFSLSTPQSTATLTPLRFYLGRGQTRTGGSHCSASQWLEKKKVQRSKRGRRSVRNS